MASGAAWLKEYIRDVVDFPRAGVVFKDLTPLLGDADAFRSSIDLLSAPFKASRVDRVLGIEARGFISAAPVAYQLGAGFVPVRKAGKLPSAAAGQDYLLEYGADRLEMHRDAINPGDRVLIVDDVLATGGTAAAAVGLVGQLGGLVVGLGFIVELAFLAGRDRLVNCPITSLITYG